MISSVSTNAAYASSMMRGGMQKPPAPPSQEEQFSKTDANGDGTIDKVELSDALAALSESGNLENAPDVDELFSMLDADGDGAITQEEHAQGMQKIKPQGGPGGGMGMMGPPPPSTQESEEEDDDLFAATDTDGNGSIDLEELSSMLRSLTESEDMDENASENLFSMLDADDDGAITSQEHRQGLEEMASAMPSSLIASALHSYQSAAMDYASLDGGNLSTSA